MEDKVRRQLLRLLNQEESHDIRYITRIEVEHHAANALVEFVDSGGNYFRRRYNSDGTTTELEV